ncbi:MAG: YggT family protein [Alphaproteobacteria bacterium]|nr:YggT family protein [Alphaproteobacteria bacterium]
MTPDNIWWDYWYLHLPNFALSAVMYTMLGRFLLGFVLPADSSNYIWRWFCRLTEPFLRAVAFITPLAAPSSAAVADWRRLAVHHPRRPWHRPDRRRPGAQPAAPGAELNRPPMREPLLLATVALAILNGLGSPLLIVVWHLAPYWLPAAVFGSPQLAFYLSSLAVSGLTLMLSGVPAALYERFAGASESTTASLAIWCASAALLSHPALGRLG